MIYDTCAKVNNCIVSYSSPFCRAYIPVDEDENNEADLKSDTKTPYITLETRGFEDNIYNKSKQRGIKWT